MTLTACEKELDFEYHETEPVVVIEGRVTNEGTEIVITKSRSVTDSVRGRCRQGALVAVSVGGKKIPVEYNAATDSYRSALTGEPGHTYTLTVDFEGRHYEATSTMPPAAPIISAEFLWQPVLKERLLVYEVWAADPEPDVRNYYWYRMDRRSEHQHLKDKDLSQPYRWAVFDDRGNPPGRIYRDLMCTSERAMDDDKEEDWERLLYDGDEISFTLMTIDRSVYDYYASLRAGQNGGANPRSNISGGCQGYFAAGSVTRTQPQVFRREDVSLRN